MDTQRFVERRKQLGYSQVTLCQGICTQSTLSKFENGLQIPSLAILSKLCARLGFSIDDLNTQDPSSIRYLRDLLTLIEENLMIENYGRVQELLEKLDPQTIQVPEEQMHYYYLEGMFAVLTNKRPAEALFSFAQILDALDEQHQTVYSQLAYLGKGVLYVRKEDLQQAAFFFDKVATYLNHLVTSATAAELQGERYFQMLTLMYYLAEYHSLLQEVTQSNELIEMALDLCGVKHVTYFLPRLKLLQAKNLILAHGELPQIKTVLNDALTFARLNRNQSVQVQIMALQKNLPAQ